MSVNSIPVAVWGVGREGLESIKWIASHPRYTLSAVIDSKPLSQKAAALVQTLVPGPELLSSPSALNPEVELVFKSPGISLYGEEARALLSRGHRFTSTTSEWLRAVNAQKSPPKVVMITGTKGKSTTSSLLNHLLNYCGVPSLLAGNIGDCPLNKPFDEYQVVVFEASSFQIADLSAYCDYSCVLNISPEHLDWHGSPETYRRDKLRLVSHTREAALVCSSLKESLEKQSPAPLSPPVKSYHNEATAGLITDFLATARRDVPASTRHVLDSLSAPHNISNCTAVFGLLELLGVQPTRALHGLLSYTPLRHRQTFLGLTEGIEYIDDSIATNPLAASVALERFASKGTVIIVGGYDRDLPLDTLVQCYKETSLAGLVTLGPMGDRLSIALKKATLDFPVMAADSMPDAIAKGKGILAKCSAGTKRLILSPAAPSFGLYNNFEERGVHFAECVGHPY